jgi:hypothetical protein
MRTFSVKNFERFQHYKDRSPPWIKLYNELLDDYEFGVLPDASKFHLVAIWLLASRSENKIPYDQEWVSRRINASGTVDLEGLARCGFIIVNQTLPSTEHDASKPQAERVSREEGQVQHIDSVPTERAPAAPPNAETELFRRGKEVLGKSSGGQIAKLKAAKGDNIALARAAIEQASTKQNPAEYIAAIIRNGAGPPAFGRQCGGFASVLIERHLEQANEPITIDHDDSQGSEIAGQGRSALA